jgi:hypothetical protein
MGKENPQLDPELEKYFSSHIEYPSTKSMEEAFDALENDPNAFTRKYIDLNLAEKQHKQEVEELSRRPLP